MDTTVLSPPEPAAASEAGARDVIFTFSYVTWEGAVRRGMNRPQDQLAATLLEGHDRVGRVLVANPFRSLPVVLARRALGQDEPFPASERARLHVPTRLRRRDPVSRDAIVRGYRAYGASLHRAASRFGLENPAVITMNPVIAGFAPLDWAGPVTFYASDDWAAAPDYRRYWPLYEETYERIGAGERRLCAVSQAIVDRIEPGGQHAVVPNGIEPEVWLDPGRPPAWLEELPRPRFLYVATVDSRVDREQVEQVARAFPDGSVILVGPVTDEDHVAPLRALPNVHLPGPIEQVAVPSIVTEADVCLVPHVRDSFTTAMSPLKLYEYLAGGRPVAATDLEPMRGIDRRVVLVPPGGDFATAAAEALRLGPADETARRDFLARNCWAARHEQVLDLALA